MSIALIVILTLTLVLLGVCILMPRSATHATDAMVADRLEACLPQTQCGQCDYPGCRPYAEAIVAGHADINQCPPGGQDTINALARLRGRATKALDPDHGEEGDAKLAFIREESCIGCKLCIKACPVDAILGAAKVMHTVIASECTGCDLCVAPCPVDCIDMIAAPPSISNWRRPLPVAATRGG